MIRLCAKIVADTDLYETDKEVQNLIDWVCLSEQIKHYSPETVKTGDPAKLMFWSIATLLSGLCLLICGVIYQKKSRGGEACD